MKLKRRDKTCLEIFETSTIKANEHNVLLDADNFGAWLVSGSRADYEQTF